MPVTRNDTPYVDGGTNSVTGPSDPEVFGDPGAEDVATDLGTGAYPGPSEPETYTSEDHEGEPTGAFPGPSEPETRYEWPAQPDGSLAPSAAADTTADLGDMTKGELLAEADRRGVDVKRSATKAEILDALS